MKSARLHDGEKEFDFLNIRCYFGCGFSSRIHTQHRHTMAEKKKSSTTETPLMTQYNAVKAQYRDAVVFFRMGDFYEMFYEDARIGAKVLGITLTSRGHGKAGDVPLAGFPYHALDGYLSKMIKAGYRVAICEQVEDPRLAKGIVKRDVIRVVTPGTVMEENLLKTNRNNFLSALFLKDGRCGLASADVSTGEFVVTGRRRNAFNNIDYTLDFFIQYGLRFSGDITVPPQGVRFAIFQHLPHVRHTHLNCPQRISRVFQNKAKPSTKCLDLLS